MELCKTATGCISPVCSNAIVCLCGLTVLLVLCGNCKLSDLWWLCIIGFAMYVVVYMRCVFSNLLWYLYGPLVW